MELSSQAWNVPFVLNVAFAEGGTDDCSVHRITAKLLRSLVAVDYCRPYSTEDGGWKREKPGRVRILSQEPFPPCYTRPAHISHGRMWREDPPKQNNWNPGRKEANSQG